GALPRGFNEAAAPYPALKHKSAGVRRTAALVLSKDVNGRKELLASGVLTDKDAQVRLAVLLALAEMPAGEEAAPALVRALNDPANITDRWIPDAITCAAARHDLYFLKAIAGSKTPLAPRALEVVGIVAEHYARGGPSKSAASVVAALADADARRAEV